MKLSVLLVSYNHSKYIEQCIRSIQMQYLNKEWEIVIADDSSTDDTPGKFAKYFSSSPVPCRKLDSDGNLGLVKNYQRGFAFCAGEYIAVIEGDDYWTDPMRLQKHIDFLDSHPNCVMSMNQYQSLLQSSSQLRNPQWDIESDFKFLSTKELAGGNKLGNLSACVFRRSAMDKLRPDLFDMPVADWMLGMVLGEYGPIALLKEAMSVYRIHDNGLWSGMKSEDQTKMILNLIDQYNRYLGFRYDAEFRRYKLQLQPHGMRRLPAISRMALYFTPKNLRRLTPRD